MIYQLNDNFIGLRKEKKYSLTSVLPDEAKVFHFEGLAADILEYHFANRKYQLDANEVKTKFHTDPEGQDWQNLVEFLTKENIIVA